LSLSPVLAGCSSPLVDAARDGREDAVRSLLPGDRKHCAMALGEAAAHERVETITILLDGGCDVNAQDHDGYTALMFAAMGGHNDAVRLLLIRKADPDRLTWDYKTAIRLARDRGHKDTAALIAQGQLIAFPVPTVVVPSPAHQSIYELFRYARLRDKKGVAKAAAAVLKAGAPAVPELARAARGDGVVNDLDASLKGPDIRRIAIRVLGLMGPTAVDAVPAVSAALDDPDLHDSAAEAIRRIGARP
jgi:hypothetical protein